VCSSDLEAAKKQYAQGAPYRQAVTGLLQGDTSKANTLLDRGIESLRTPEGAMDVALSFAPLGITAFHGSPYKFDKFDPAKIGTGEGAQVYGHGLYFAESPDVAKEYQKNLSKDILFTPKGEPFDPFNQLTNINVRSAFNRTKSVDDSILKAKDLMKSLSPDTQGYELAKKDLDILSSIKQKGGITEGTGSLYKVDIADETIPKMLDWDKPLNEQSIEVQKSISPIIKSYGLLGSEKGSSLYQATKELLGQESKLMNKRDALFNKYQKEGMNLSDTVKSMSPKDRKEFSLIAERIGNLKNTPQMASDYLQKRGITGIQYLDQGSRAAGEGTRNFVVFNPETIKILERN
jgi:hypothetical protein